MGTHYNLFCGVFFMSTHNECFCGEMRTISRIWLKNCLIWSYDKPTFFISKVYVVRRKEKIKNKNNLNTSIRNYKYILFKAESFLPINLENANNNYSRRESNFLKLFSRENKV